MHTGELRQLTAKKEVILSAGAINTPHILLHSGIGDCGELKSIGISCQHSLPSVGKNMTDQPYYPVVWSVNSTGSPYVNSPALITSLFMTPYNVNRVDSVAALEEWKQNHTGPYTMSPTASNHMIFLRLPDDSPILQTTQDPAAGPNTPHMELTPLVKWIYS